MDRAPTFLTESPQSSNMTSDYSSDISQQSEEKKLDLTAFSPEVLEFMLGVIRARKQDNSDVSDRRNKGPVAPP
jgi:hypothetical protein